jgi:thiol-disulfide isomerase/thioredoxin
VNIGPLALSSALLALLFGIIAGLAAAGFMAKRGYANAGNALYLALGIGLLIARAIYVASWWPHYVQQPASALNIRDGGFNLVAGLIGLIAAALLIGWRRPLLRRPLAMGVAVGIAAWAFSGLAARALTETAHLPLPALVVTKLDGHDMEMEQLRGQPTVINLWATWCGPCRRELPALAEAQRTMPQIRFVFADQGESAAAVKQFMQTQGLSLNDVVIDGNLQLSQYYRARGYPTTLFLDARGQLRDMHIGELSRATLAERIARIRPSANPRSP